VWAASRDVDSMILVYDCMIGIAEHGGSSGSACACSTRVYMHGRTHRVLKCCMGGRRATNLHVDEKNCLPAFFDRGAVCQSRPLCISVTSVLHRPERSMPLSELPESPSGFSCVPYQERPQACRDMSQMALLMAEAMPCPGHMEPAAALRSTRQGSHVLRSE
jgi:hypothetical protein